MQQFLTAIAFIFIFSSCSDNSKSSLAVFKATLEGFEQSNKNISNNSFALYKEFERKLTDPISAYKEEIWNPKVLRIKELSSELTTYIQELKNQLKNKVGVTKENEKEFYLLENINAVNKLFVVEGKGEELLLKLKGFKKEILNVDPKITRVFEDKLIITSEGFESSENSQKDFSKTFFNHLPAVGALVLLSKFENNVLIIENQFVTFCNFQQSYRDIFFSTFNTLIGQSSNYLKGGDELEITAGVGAFSTTNNPKITVNDKLIPLENGVAIYKIKAQLKAGKYFIPVKIEYITEDGRKEVVTKNISYTVIE